MSELSKKAIEAGIIPQQAVKLMQFWKSIPEDMPEHELQSLTEGALLKHLVEIETLLEKESVLPEMRETDLNLSRLYFENRKLCNIQVTRQLSFSVYGAYLEHRNAIVFAIVELRPEQLNVVAARGNVVSVDSVRYLLDDVEIRFLGERPEYIVCKVRRLEDADVPNV